MFSLNAAGNVEQNAGVSNLRSSLCDILQMATILLNVCQGERRRKEHQFDVSERCPEFTFARDIQRQGFFLKVCECVRFRAFRGVDLVTLPAAVMLIAIQVVVRRL